jgi:ribonuclease P protein component
LFSPEEEQKVASVSQCSDGRLRKNERLKKTKEFEKVFRKGRKLTGRFVALHYVYNNEDLRRVGVTVSKRVDKKAVTRNRLKRRFREIFRLAKDAFPAGCDLVFRALPKSVNASYGELRNEILSLAENIRPEKSYNTDDQVL